MDRDIFSKQIYWQRWLVDISIVLGRNVNDKEGHLEQTLFVNNSVFTHKNTSVKNIFIQRDISITNISIQRECVSSEEERSYVIIYTNIYVFHAACLFWFWPSMLMTLSLSWPTVRLSMKSTLYGFPHPSILKLWEIYIFRFFFYYFGAFFQTHWAIV